MQYPRALEIIELLLCKGCWGKVKKKVLETRELLQGEGQPDTAVDFVRLEQPKYDKGWRWV